LSRNDNLPKKQRLENPIDGTSDIGMEEAGSYGNACSRGGLSKAKSKGSKMKKQPRKEKRANSFSSATSREKELHSTAKPKVPSAPSPYLTRLRKS